MPGEPGASSRRLMIACDMSSPPPQHHVTLQLIWNRHARLLSKQRAKQYGDADLRSQNGYGAGSCEKTAEVSAANARRAAVHQVRAGWFRAAPVWCEI
jgi:hypothetical protein